jgi:hypothetical protein
MTTLKTNLPKTNLPKTNLLKTNLLKTNLLKTNLKTDQARPTSHCHSKRRSREEPAVPRSRQGPRARHDREGYDFSRGASVK